MGCRESGSWFRARGFRVKSKNPGEPHPKVLKKKRWFYPTAIVLFSGYTKMIREFNGNSSSFSRLVF